MSLEIRFRIRVKDLAQYVERAFGGLDRLEAHLRAHPRDSARVLVYEALLRNGDKPNRVLTFGRLYIGDPRTLLSAAKFELLEHLMRNPGLSLRELARGLGKDAATVSEHLRELEREGLVVRDSAGPGRPAALRAVPREIHIRLRHEPEGATA